MTLQMKQTAFLILWARNPKVKPHIPTKLKAQKRTKRLQRNHRQIKYPIILSDTGTTDEPIPLSHGHNGSNDEQQAIGAD